MLHRLSPFFLLAVLGIFLFAPANTMAQASPSPDVSSLAVPNPSQVQNVSPRGVRLGQETTVWIELQDAPLAIANGEHAKQLGGKFSRNEQGQYIRKLHDRQNEIVTRVRAWGGREIGRVSRAHNAVAMTVRPRDIAAIRNLPGVKAVRPVINYQLDLSETVPYIGATAVQNMGYDGSGVRVAVIDSGIDYTHKNLMGPGTSAAFQTAYGTGPSDPANTMGNALFPSGKVVGGYDFVGEFWNGTATSPALAPDSNPIDIQGHGTHVADIIAGKSLDGTHKGVAPGAELYAIKACATPSTSCSGVALLEAVDYALDPNQDDSIDDAVDIISLSVGSNYGQKEDDLSLALANAVRAGVVVVAAAGNAGNRPYIVSSPSTAPEVLSVAQTEVPSGKLQWIAQSGTNLVAGLFQEWSAPLTSTLTGQLAYGVGSDKIACTGYAPNSLTGKIVLVDRATCSVSIKISNIAAAGGIAGIVANNVATGPGDPPPSFSFGGGTPAVPGFTVTLADGVKLRSYEGQTITIDPSNSAVMSRSVVSTSARGPDMSYNAVKPEIGAPGASVSAIAGTGDQETAFGGTSGATPMVSGAAALVLQNDSKLTPPEVKAKLVTTAETSTYVNPASLPGYLAEATRIGGGEVRVDRAIAATFAAWDAKTLAGSISFGYQAAPVPVAVQKQLLIRNFKKSARVFSLRPTFLYTDDATSRAVTFVMPSSFAVSGNRSAIVPVTIIIDPTKLPVWSLNGGSRGGDGYRLDGVEYDGYINISASGETIHVPWQVLPHKAAAVKAMSTSVNLKKGSRQLKLMNAGVLDGRVDVFSLLGSSPQIPRANLPDPGDNFAIVDLRYVGARLVSSGGGDAIQFAINTFGERSHPNYPAEFDVYIDTNLDGSPEYVIYNAENGGFGVTGQNVNYVYNLTTGAAAAYFYSDADLDSANMILTAPLAALGLSASSKFNFSVYAFDNYFTGSLTDSIENITYTPATPRYLGTGIPDTGVPARRNATMTVSSTTDGASASPSQTGLLLMYRDAIPKAEAEAVVVY